MRFFLAVLAAASLSSLAPARADWDPRTEKEEKSDLLGKARAGIAAFREADPSLNVFFDQAYGYAIFPSVTKGGAGLGAARGKGILYQGGAPAKKVQLSQYTIGAQFGGKKYRELIFFSDKAAYDRFVEGDFEFSAQVHATVASDGAGSTAAYEDGIAVFIQDKAGAMLEASVGGQTFKVRPLD
jgi:lipid-binding SYLF domain-containing protein